MNTGADHDFQTPVNQDCILSGQDEVLLANMLESRQSSTWEESMQEELCHWIQNTWGRKIDVASKPTSAKLVCAKEMAQYG